MKLRVWLAVALVVILAAGVLMWHRAVSRQQNENKMWNEFNKTVDQAVQQQKQHR